jgi:two-component system LytT family sensor kinase
MGLGILQPNGTRMTARNHLDKLIFFLSRRPVYHTAFWLALFALLMLTGRTANLTWSGKLVVELIALGSYMAVVYINLLYLVPVYLARRPIVYVLLLVFVSMLVVPLKTLLLYLFFEGSPDAQEAVVREQWIGIVGILLAGLGSTVLKIILDWLRYQQEKQELMTQNMQSEIRFLKSQINPHFLFNTLNNLYALTLKKSDAAPDMVLKLADIMRYMLYECNEKMVPLSKEIAYMQHYLDLERLRQPTDADITLTVRGSINDLKVAPLLFVPFLENSFKHGLNHNIHGAGFVHISLEATPGKIVFQIDNSKPARRDTPPDVNGGIGLMNVQYRLKLLYPDAHNLQISDKDGVFSVVMEIYL